MNVFGIAVSSGHLILIAVGIVIYDAVWTWVLGDTVSDWWFKRLQALLKFGIYCGALAVVALIAVTPWPWNLVIAVSAVLAVLFISLWLKNRS